MFIEAVLHGRFSTPAGSHVNRYQHLKTDSGPGRVECLSRLIF
jgi:hypothetical protein